MPQSTTPQYFILGSRVSHKPMNRTLENIPAFVFLVVGAFLLMHGHPVAGGWCIVGAFLSAK